MTECPICNGKGYVYNALGSFNEDCGHCQGTGKVRVEGEPMTNEEYLRSCNTEELATFLAIVQYDGTDLTLKKNHVEKWVEWLKEIHE